MQSSATKGAVMPPSLLVRFHSTAAFVVDIDRAKRFYIEILGQEIDLDFGKNVILKCGITLWEIDPLHVIPRMAGVEAIRDEAVNRFEFYFETEDIETVCQKLATAGVMFLHPVHEEPWGQKTVRFFDPDRHLIEMGETLAVFVRRLYAGGLPAEGVSAKTGVPIDKVREILK
jgi:catechol 2,3-dioxygenase-like lactoylglutathione lyase family enzyme